jgi:hypothetical protein
MPCALAKPNLIVLWFQSGTRQGTYTMGMPMAHTEPNLKVLWFKLGTLQGTCTMRIQFAHTKPNLIALWLSSKTRRGTCTMRMPLAHAKINLIILWLNRERGKVRELSANFKDVTCWHETKSVYNADLHCATYHVIFCHCHYALVLSPNHRKPWRLVNTLKIKFSC